VYIKAQLRQHITRNCEIKTSGPHENEQNMKLNVPKKYVAFEGGKNRIHIYILIRLNRHVD